MPNSTDRNPAGEPFPVPEWPPIQSPDSIDIIAQRHDGGVSLVVVASQPVDDRPETLDAIRHKVTTYLTAIGLDEFQAEIGHPPREKTEIVIVCEHPIHPDAVAVIAHCRDAAATAGVRLEVRAAMGAAPLPLPDPAEAMARSIRPATEADHARLAGQAAVVLGMLQPRYGDVALRQTADDLGLLQRLQDDGMLATAGEDELEAVGDVFGRVLAARTPLRWITVVWQGERALGLQYPGTTVVVFPGSMIAKRVGRGERVEFGPLFDATVAQVEQLKDDPEYAG